MERITKIEDLREVECITKIEDLREWIDLTLKRGALTNCYLGLTYYQKYMDEKSLYFININGNRFLLHDLGGYDKIYYCFSAEALDKPLQHINSSSLWENPNRPAFTEIIYKETKGLPENILSYFEKMGFQNQIKRLRMSVKNPDFKNALESEDEKQANEEEKHAGLANEDRKQAAEQIPIRLASGDDAAPILSLITQSFDPYTSCIPKKDAFLDILAQNRVLAAYDTNGRIVGAFHFEVEKSAAVVNHLVVSAEARGQGLAGRLLAEGRALCDQGAKPLWRLWVRQDNKTAQNMYIKYGFQFDGTCCLSILNEQTC